MRRLTSAVRRLDGDGERALTGVTELQQQLETLVDVLIQAGTLKPGHAALLARLRKRVEIARTPAIELSDVDDKYQEVGEPIDCESRLALCQARCCSFQVTLSRQDLLEGEVAWEIDRPYRLPRSRDGYCMYLARDADEVGRCTNYQVRPATCRSYSCKDDARVWIDFDARIPAPMPDTLDPLVHVTRRKPAG
ncbi:MAG: YkgJ family cysteine cluster protein [Deltaproteobacteria bacterium]|nr:YkgJ family cysteine cluster protein [Deltaproteobacteria bacterium]